MNIAICDNEEIFVKNISGLLEEYLNENKLQYSIDMYSSGSELIGLKDKIVNYDIVFLDINMTGIDNIKVAEWIRMYSDRVIIISITLMSDYNIQGYKYDVFRCVLKDTAVNIAMTKYDYVSEQNIIRAELQYIPQVTGGDGIDYNTRYEIAPYWVIVIEIPSVIGENASKNEIIFVNAIDKTVYKDTFSNVIR